MSNVLPIINQQGPLPITATVEVMGDGPAVLMLSGSVWTTTPNKMIGVAVMMDGVQVARGTIFANPASTHMAVVSTITPIKVTYGQHKFQLVPLNADTVSDVNDYYSLLLHF